MAIRVALNHKTRYRYDRLVSLSPHVFRLRPAVHSRTPILAYSLTIKPETHFINWQQDPFGNFLARVVFQEQARELSVEVDLIAELTVINPFDFFVNESAQYFPFQYDDQLKRELIPYLEIKDEGPLLKKWMAKIDITKRKIVDFLVDLNRSLCADINYAIRMEPGIQTCDQTLEKALGSCRDTGWLLVQILRHLGLAARFVSGYLVQLTADEKSLDGPSGTEKDFTDLHAWTEVYVPGAGWIGLDPTSGLFAGEGHIPLACTPDPSSAAPITGFTDLCETEFFYKNTVQRIHEDPRVTKPYTDKEWEAINGLGRKVDDVLDKFDVRLTMGGEPTFISIDDMDGPEWNFTADSTKKRRLANDLLKRLRQNFSPGGMLHFGQGKWYPGEELPRWRLSCYWRNDGISIWKKDELIGDNTKEYGFKTDDANRFLTTLTEQLGLSKDTIIPAYEDTFYYSWKEGTLPQNVDPLKSNLKDPLERQYLARLLDRDLGSPQGFILPLSHDEQGDTWKSSGWNLRREHLFLIPGGSPLGLRLPLDSLDWVEEKDRERQYECSLFEEKEPLRDFHNDKVANKGESTKSDKEANYLPENTVRTALCTEVRDGRLYVFMPPLSHLEHYLDLVATLEYVADKLQMPIILEGYEPPLDNRIQKLLVTPDPGVIEVNIHPSKNWDELVNTVTVLYEQARLSRLGTEKFMLDGRHTGTGGGNHVVLGGPTPSDSPMLRRPDILRSLITYWQIHPALSYLFSGLFIGPTSQAPRIDEGRNDYLYELDIAFQQMPEGVQSDQFWLVDRLLRHLLVDLTGNTHRAEFCIDKLYSPDTESGRQGLVELRAFEMPPHARMSLVQMLLLRVLIAWFWEYPCKRSLIHWGTDLHDRFMLPHFIWSDMKDVVKDLQNAGYPFQVDWLNPFFEFRFPKYGAVSFQNIEMELRFAIEPWHVLGEEVVRGGTARFVDSSVERIQVKVKGLIDDRHIVTCNSRRIPLHPTGVRGEYVTGVRFRAWDPHSALHPTIGVHSPLVFDVVDTWNSRSIGGCSYHIAHRGGLSYDTLPVNAYEAEARRVSRFWDINHTPGKFQPPPATGMSGKFIPRDGESTPVTIPVEEINQEFPYTLDLRRQPSRI